MTKKLTREYFRKQGAIGGKTRDAKKGAQTLIEKYGPDYFKNLRAMREAKKEKDPQTH